MLQRMASLNQVGVDAKTVQTSSNMSRTSRHLTKSYIHVPKTTPSSGKTIGQTFNETADNNPDREMYVFYADKERKTYRQVQEESQQFAGAMLKLGLKKGDTLGVWGGNHYEWLLAYIASLQLGIITVHMRIDFPLDVQRKILEKLGIRVLVLMRSPSDLLDNACEIVPELLTNDAHNLNCQSSPMLKYVINAGSKKVRGAFSLSEFMAIGKDVDRSEVDKACQKVDLDDRLGVFFTSGSTGFPKGATHTHRSVSIFLDTFDDAILVSEDADGNHIDWTSRFALIMSFGGIGAQMGALLPILQSATSIIVAPTYDKDMLVNAIHEERVTGSTLLIHHLNDILNTPNIDSYDFSSLQMCFSGGSIIPRSLRDRAKKITKHILLMYGGTEGFGSLQSPKDSQELLDSAAYFPSAGTEAKIIGEDGCVLPNNTAGEICFRSASLFLYYWGDEEKTKAAKHSNGWYHTGDVGSMDEHGYITLSGRIAERIIKEGLNIAPGDLEKVLDTHPAVNNVMVVGVPDERTSEEVCAVVRLKPSVKVTSEELVEFCQGKVSNFLVPKYILFMEDAFPITETGKFHRKKIAEQAKCILGL